MRPRRAAELVAAEFAGSRRQRWPARSLPAHGVITRPSSAHSSRSFRLRIWMAIREPASWTGRSLYAEALVGLGRLRDAEAVVARVHAYRAGAQPSPGPRRRRTDSGMLDAALGHADDAEVSFVSSLAILDVVDLPFERALTELEYGRFLLREGYNRAAVWQLEAARETLRRARRPALCCRVPRALARCGLPPRTRAAMQRAGD